MKEEGGDSGGGEDCPSLCMILKLKNDPFQKDLWRDLKPLEVFKTA